MSSVDQRVVEMRFDNQNFERGVRASVKSLDDLKKGLDLEGATKSLSNLDKVGKNFSLAGMASGIESIANRFTNLGIIGMSVLNNLTNQAIYAGQRFISALTIDPIFSGFNEYETKIGAIQTILTNTASKGTKLEDVTKALDQLNEYADQTIYNFAEMARNIGTFTAAGVDLKTSVASIKGIANLAAGSGSSALQASTAMYQLSQAIASGSVKLMDWNSVVNAGMGGELFQNALKKTAKQMGVFVDEGKPFRETLEQGWLSASVLTKTLKKFADDESLVKAATEVKTFTQLISTMKESMQSGWAQSWEQIIGNKNESSLTLTAISNAFGEVIGKSSKARNEMLSFWNANGGRTAIIQGLANSLKTLSSVLEPIEKAFRDLFPPLNGKKLVELSIQFKNLTDNFKIGEETAKNIGRSFKGLFALIDIGKQMLLAMGNGLFTILKYLLPVGNGFLSFTGNIGDFIVSIRDALKSADTFNVIIKNIWNALKPLADGIIFVVSIITNSLKSLVSINTSGVERFTNIFTTLGETVKKIAPSFYNMANIVSNLFKKISEGIILAFNSANFNSIFDVINGGLFASILFGLKKFIGSITNITNNAGGFIGQFTDILDGVKGSLQAYQSQLKAGILMKIAIAIGILSASLVALSLVDSKKLTIALSAMTIMFMELFTSMSLFTKFAAGPGFLTIMKTVSGMIAMSIAVLILSSAVSKLSKLDWPGLSKGLLGVGVILAELALFMKITDLNGLGLLKSVGLIALSTSIVILAEAVKIFSQLNTSSIIKGLAAIGLVLTEVGIFINLTGDSKRVISTAIGLTLLGTSMIIFSKAISMMGNMSLDTIGKGLLTMAGALTIVGIAMNSMPINMLLTSVGLIAVSGALIILSNALSNMGGMSWIDIAKGLVTLASSLTIIAIAMSFMTTALPGAAALLVVAGALTILTPVLKSLGDMNLTDIGKGLLAIAGIFTVLGIAGLALGSLTPVILALSGAIALFGVGCVAVGAGILAFSIGLSTLAVSGAAGAAALVVIITSIVGLIPMAVKALATGIIEFVRVLGEGSKVIANAIKNVVIAVIDVLVDVIPIIVNGIYKLILSIIKILNTYLPMLVDAGTTLIVTYINTLANTLRKNKDPLIEAMGNLISSLIDFAMQAFAYSIKGFVDIGKNIVDGLINGMKSMLQKAANTASDLGNSVLESAKKSLGINSPSKLFQEIGANLSNAMSLGINKESPKAKDSSNKLGEDVSSSVASGINKNSSQTTKATKDMAEAIKKEFDKSMEWISDRKYYNQLSLKEELSAYERMQKRYKEGSEERKKIDKEVYRVKMEMIKAEEDAQKKRFEDSKAIIEEEDFYERLTTREKLKAWEDLRKVQKEGSEEQKKADREVFQLRKQLIKEDDEAFKTWVENDNEKRQSLIKANTDFQEKTLKVIEEATEKKKTLEDDYYNKTKEINDKLKSDIKTVSDEYIRALDARTNALYNSYGLFDKIDVKESIDGKELIQNLKDQITEFDTWSSTIQDLANKGIDEGLVKELRDMGPKSLSQIKALNSLTSPELDNYVSLWRTKHADAKEQAVNELEGLRISSLNKIKELERNAVDELEKYKVSWKTKLDELQIQTLTQLQELKTEWIAKIGPLRAETETHFKDMSKNIQDTIKDPNWSALGADIVNGIKGGVLSKASELAIATANMAREALDAAKGVLGIQSPSKEFALLGRYSVEGFVQGLRNFSGDVVNTATKVGNNAISALKKTISNISEVLTNDLDNTPVIRPVLDLTNIETGSQKISELLSQKQGLNVSSIVSKVPNIQTNSNGSSTSQNGSSSQAASISFTQNNYSPKALSRIDIYRQTKNQLSVMKGMVRTV